jgi:hypothetical protein
MDVENAQYVLFAFGFEIQCSEPDYTTTPRSLPNWV